MAADAGVDLVKDHAGNPVVFRACRLHRQHQARKLAAGRRFIQRVKWLAGVGRDIEAHMVVPSGSRHPLSPWLRGLKDAGEARILHAQVAQLRFHQAFKPGRQGLARLRQQRRLGTVGLELFLIIRFGAPQAVLHALQPGQFAFHFLMARSQLICRHAVAALQTANQIQTLLHGLAALRVEILALQHVAQLNAKLLRFIES